MSINATSNATSGETHAAVGSHALKRGSLTWAKVAAIGVSISVAGCFAGWNYGLAAGGWGGMLVALLATGLLFFCLTQAVAELSAAMPMHAGFDAYVREILGPVAGFVAGVCVALGLAVGTGLAFTFTAAYTEGMFGVGGWPVKGALLVALLAVHLRGAKEAVGFTMLVGAVAVAALVVFCAAMAPHFDAGNLYSETQDGRSLLPGGLLGIIQSVPFALFMLLGVEQAAQGAAEVDDPASSMPRALVTAIVIAFALAVAVLIVATGSTGAALLTVADDPLLAAVQAQPQGSVQAVLGHVIGTGALVAILAAFFSIAYGSSRQLHHLASSGALPGWLARTNRRGAPVTALAVVAVVGAVTAMFPPEAAMVVFIFLMMLTYELLLIAFVRFQRARPDVARPYRAIGGRAVGWIGAILGLAAALCCYQLQIEALSYALVALAALLVYFVWRRRPA
jgi:ethanolamine permease